MKLLSLTVVRTDDWEAVYNQYGHKVDEGHSINWLVFLKTNVSRISKVYWIDEKYVYYYGFPNRFSEFKKEELKEIDI